MALVSTLPLAHLPASYAVHAALFTSVDNAAFLRQQLLAGNSDYEYAFLDATAIIGTTQLCAAIFRAVNDLLGDRLRTRNVHSEIVFSLSPNNNIAQSFRRFGVSDATKHLLALKVSTPARPFSAETVRLFLSQNISAQPVAFSDESISAFTDWPSVSKIYDLRPTSSSKKPKQDQPNGTAAPAWGSPQRREAELTVMAMMALKGS